MIKEYDELKSEYLELFDVDDPVLAFGLMKKASAICEYLESQHAKYVRLALEMEKQAEALEARTSIGNGKSVAEGKRFAEQDPLVVEAWRQFQIATEKASTINAQARHTLRIYYDTKRVWELGEKKERYNG